ncbi:hypothetical protein B0H13DRAFT_2387780 [Mycena leptocephala]|nr:hypothetical protein B0H13DRAFT_2387780 [Mycena leptocephala]
MPMPPSATFCNIPLPTTFDPDLERSVVCLDWVLNSEVSTANSLMSGRLYLLFHGTADSVCSLRMHLPVSAALSFDLVLGRNWLQLCFTSFGTARFYLSSGALDFRTYPEGTAFLPPLHLPALS